MATDGVVIGWHTVEQWEEQFQKHIGWLLYTAASAGDLHFVQELLQKDPLWVSREGEYGVTDVLYAAARSKNSEVFRVIYEFAMCPRLVSGNGEAEIPCGYKQEMKNKGVHALARGGNLKILKEVLCGCSNEDVLGYRDVQCSTVLQTAAARGQVEPNDVWCMTNKMKGTSLFASICTPTGQCTAFHVGVTCEEDHD